MKCFKNPYGVFVKESKCLRMFYLILSIDELKMIISF